MKRNLSWIVYVVILVVGILGTRGCNMLWNNREIVKDGYTSKSRATGLTGHIEYTKYSDGSQDVKVYHGLGHRVFGSELYQDLDGDNKVDRIRYNGAEWKFNRLTKILIREEDINSNTGVFTKADKRLQELK